MKIQLARTYMEVAEEPIFHGKSLEEINPNFRQDTVLAKITDFDDAFRQKIQDAAQAQLSDYWDTFYSFKKDDGQYVPDWDDLTENDAACFHIHAEDKYGYIRYTPDAITFFAYLGDIDQDVETDWLDILPFIKQFTTEKAPA